MQCARRTVYGAALFNRYATVKRVYDPTHNVGWVYLAMLRVMRREHGGYTRASVCTRIMHGLTARRPLCARYFQSVVGV